MGRFSNLTQGKGKTVHIGEYAFEIKPLTGEHLGLLMEMGDGKNTDAMKELIYIVLKKADNTITKEDVNEIPLKQLTELMESIMEVNELT